jgi:hypothetical protein
VPDVVFFSVLDPLVAPADREALASVPIDDGQAALASGHRVQRPTAGADSLDDLSDIGAPSQRFSDEFGIRERRLLVPVMDLTQNLLDLLDGFRAVIQSYIEVPSSGLHGLLGPEPHLFGHRMIGDSRTPVGALGTAPDRQPECEGEGNSQANGKDWETLQSHRFHHSDCRRIGR